MLPRLGVRLTAADDHDHDPPRHESARHIAPRSCDACSGPSLTQPARRFSLKLAPSTTELRDYARRQTGCKALIAARYGIGPLCAVTILAELGDPRRFDNSRDAVRYGGLEYHRQAIRPAPRFGTPLPSRIARAALGAV